MTPWRPFVGLVIVLSACSQDIAGPDIPVLVGAFGTSAELADLLATRAGVQFNWGCSTYFVSSDGARLDAAGHFLVRGKSYSRGRVLTAAGANDVLEGTFESRTGTVDLTLQREGSDPQVAVHHVLHEGERYTDLIVCPA